MITLQVGALVVSKSFQDDQRAAAVLHAFHAAHGLGEPTDTNRQKLEAIRDWFIATVQQKAKLHHIETSRATAEQEAEDQYNFETAP
jgi:hypothetical protein